MQHNMSTQLGTYHSQNDSIHSQYKFHIVAYRHQWLTGDRQMAARRQLIASIYCCYLLTVSHWCFATTKCWTAGGPNAVAAIMRALNLFQAKNQWNVKIHLSKLSPLSFPCLWCSSSHQPNDGSNALMLTDCCQNAIQLTRHTVLVELDRVVPGILVMTYVWACKRAIRSDGDLRSIHRTDQETL